MFYKKSLALISATTLITTSLLFPASTLADSCSTYITGNELSGIICDFDSGNSVTVESAGELGGIHQESYSPVSSFISNSGTITSEDIIGIHLSDSRLTNGLANSGTISTIAETAIFIENQSEVDGGFSNSGTISSEYGAVLIYEAYINNGISNSGTISSGSNSAILLNFSSAYGGIDNSGIITSSAYMALQIDDESIVLGDITNSGSITSTSDNNPAMLIRSNSLVSGNLTNSGTIQATGDGDGLLMHNEATLSGNIANSGLMQGYRGIVIDYSTLTGNLNNSGTITGDSLHGIHILNDSVVSGSLTNSGTISGAQNGISLTNAGTISGAITNLALGNISAGQYGILIDEEADVNGGIVNYGRISGDVAAINISADSNVANIDIYEGSVIVGSVYAPNTTLNVIDGGEIEGAVQVNIFNIAQDATFNMGHTITAQNVNNSGELRIGTTTQTIAGDYTQQSGGVISVEAQNTTTYGQLAVTGAVDLSISGAIDVNIADDTNFKIGDRLSNVISGDSLTVPTSGFEVTDNSRLLNFSASLNNSNNGVHLTAVDDSDTSILQSTAATGNKASAGAAAMIDEISQNATGDWVNVAGAFNKMSSDGEIASAVNQTTPTLQGATNVAIIESMSTSMRIIQARQDSNSGLSSGEDFKTNRNLWVKPFGSWGSQGNKDGVVGYDSKSYGVIAGVDKDVSENTNLGVGFSYASSTLKSNDTNNRVSVDSFLGIGYGDYRLDDKTKINAQFALGYNHSESTRRINFGGLNRSASGSYHGWNLQAGAGVSHVIKISEATTIAPEIRMDYFMVGNRAYEESGAGALNLHVGSQRQDQLIPAFDLKANHNFMRGFSFALNAGVGYDLLHDENAVTASFTDNGGFFITRGLEVSPWILRSGAGLMWKQSDDLDFTARYDRRDRGSNYDNQTVSVKVRKAF